MVEIKSDIGVSLEDFQARRKELFENDLMMQDSSVLYYEKY